jgi:hypothetical protein
VPEFQGEEYRDDRIFVINLCRGTVTRAGQARRNRWMVETYRNAPSLPAYRSDDFGTRDEAVTYIKKIEPLTPIISNGGQSLDTPEGEDQWNFWMNWLDGNGLKSALSGYQHVPEWVNGKRRDNKVSRPYRPNRPTSVHVIEVVDELERLKAFITKHGHSIVAANYRDLDGFKLGNWVEMCRERYRNSELSSEEFQKLDRLVGWEWDLL